MHTPTPSRRQKAIRKLNNIVIARLTTNKRPNILSNTWRFDTSADWKMLGKEFETWPADPLSDPTLITVGMCVTNLGYLEDGSRRFTKLPNSGTEESNKMLVELDTAAVIPEADNQDLPDLIDLEAERANKKKEKAERRRQRKINLAQATTACGAPLSPDASARRPPSSLVASVGGASSASAGSAPSSPVAGVGHLSDVFCRPSSPVAGGSLCLLFLVVLRLLLLVVVFRLLLWVVIRLLLLVVVLRLLFRVVFHLLLLVVVLCLLFRVVFWLILLVVVLYLLFRVVFHLLCPLLAPGHYS